MYYEDYDDLNKAKQKILYLMNMKFNDLVSEYNEDEDIDADSQMEKNIKLKLKMELMVIAAKIVKLELNKYHLKKVTEITNQIWGCENIENHFNYFQNELKNDYKFYKKHY